MESLVELVVDGSVLRILEHDVCPAEGTLTLRPSAIKLVCAAQDLFEDNFTVRITMRCH